MAMGALVAFTEPWVPVALCGGAIITAIALPRPIVAVCLLAFAGFWAVAAIPGVPSATGAGQVARAGLVVIVSAQSVWLLDRHGWPSKRATASLLALSIIMLLALMTTDRRADDWPLATVFALALLAFIACASSVVQIGTADRLVRALAFTYAVLVLLNAAAIAVARSGAFITTQAGQLRFRGVLENPNSVGLLGFVGASVFLGAAALARKGSFERAGWIALVPLLALELYLSGSRAGIAGFLASLGVQVVLLTHARPALRWGATTIAVVLALALTTSDATARISQTLRVQSIGDVGGRAVVWPLLVDQIKTRPVLGHGYGSSRDFIVSLGSVRGFTGDYSGNVVLDAAFEMGILGVTALSVILLLSTRGAYRALRGGSARCGVVAATTLALLAGGILNAQAESFLLSIGGASFVAFWLAVSLGLCLPSAPDAT